MKNYLVVFMQSEKRCGIEMERVLTKNGGVQYEGTYTLFEGHSFHIFAIEEQFSLNLVSNFRQGLDRTCSIGVIDEDELSWMVCSDLAA